MLLLCRFRTSVTESDVSVMEFRVLAQIFDLSALNVIPFFGNEAPILDKSNFAGRQLEYLLKVILIGKTC